MVNAAKSNETKYGDSPEVVVGWIESQLENCKDKVFVAKGWCKKCGNCIAFCPVKALDRDREGFPTVNNQRCVSCGTCEIMCPDFAIIVCNLIEKTRK